MNMLTLHGKVANVYESAKGVNKTTGETYGGEDRLQLMCENRLRNGERRFELFDLSIDDAGQYRSRVGQAVNVPVGVYVNNGKPQFYAIKNDSALAPESAAA